MALKSSPPISMFHKSIPRHLAPQRKNRGIPLLEKIGKMTEMWYKGFYCTVEWDDKSNRYIGTYLNNGSLYVCGGETLEELKKSLKSLSIN